MDNTKSEKRVFIVPSATIARKLLKMGYVVCDIKPHRDNQKATVFLFEDTAGIRDDYFRLSDEMKNNQER